MDFTGKEVIKRYAKMALGRPFSPVVLNLLITSVCDMRCVHCFFTDELDDRSRKAKQIKAEEVEKISRTLGGNLAVLIVAGGEPFTRKDLPEVVGSFYRNNKLDSAYLMSNGQIQKRILPDVERLLKECPKLNVTVALGIDGLKDEHEKIRQKPGSWDLVIDTARQLQNLKKSFPRLDVQTCTCLMHSNQERIFDWYEFLKRDLQPDKINVNYIRPPAARSEELDIDLDRYWRLSRQIDEDTRHQVIKNHYSGRSGYFKAAIDVYMHGLIAQTVADPRAHLKCWAGTAGAVIYDEGTLSSCEILGPIGNLRDVDWDFQQLWKSPAMAERRKKVASGCFCTHESNCYYPSLPLNPRHLVKIKKLEWEMKRSARLVNIQ